eukprot:GFYU01003845.1.p2 GENE.GFYU01003845.1~~GFYU01003845.1.p2  ORF type:complete len:111 (-),score=40.17 GFYU01003845.1:398-730(-)
MGAPSYASHLNNDDTTDKRKSLTPFNKPPAYATHVDKDKNKTVSYAKELEKDATNTKAGYAKHVDKEPKMAKKSIVGQEANYAHHLDKKVKTGEAGGLTIKEKKGCCTVM